MQKYNVEISDIKPLMEVSDHSLLYLSIVGGFMTLVVLFGLYMLFKFFKERKKHNIRKEAYKNLQNIDLNDPKKAAYAISKYAATFKDDSTRHNSMYLNLVERLGAYKYKKEVEPFSDEVKGYIELYRGMIDV